MGKDAADAEVVQREHLTHGVQLLRLEAEAAEAGIHRQMHPRVHMQGVDGLGLSQTLH